MHLWIAILRTAAPTRAKKSLGWFLSRPHHATRSSSLSPPPPFPPLSPFPPPSSPPLSPFPPPSSPPSPPSLLPTPPPQVLSCRAWHSEIRLRRRDYHHVLLSYISSNETGGNQRLVLHEPSMTAFYDAEKRTLDRSLCLCMMQPHIHTNA